MLCRYECDPNITNINNLKIGETITDQNNKPYATVTEVKLLVEMEVFDKGIQKQIKKQSGVASMGCRMPSNISGFGDLNFNGFGV